MDITNIAIAIVSALGGGGLASILNHKQDSIKLVINTLQQENKEAQEDLKELRKTLENFQNKIRIQELQLIALESTHYGHPWPLWIKDLEGKYVMINKAFENLLLTPNKLQRYDVIGKTDHEIWPEKFHNTYSQSDQEVLTKRVIVETLYSYPMKNLNKEELVWTVKYPLILNSTIVGIGGSCVPVQNILDTLEKI